MFHDLRTDMRLGWLPTPRRCLLAAPREAETMPSIAPLTSADPHPLGLADATSG
jgi:hypothetical protein